MGIQKAGFRKCNISLWLVRILDYMKRNDGKETRQLDQDQVVKIFEFYAQ